MASRELDSAPGARSLYPKAVLGLVPRPGRSSELPDTQLVLRDIEIDRDHLAEYDRVCGFRFQDTLPATYPHIMAFPLQMELMTAGDFPFPAIGMVHIENRIEVARPLTADDTLEVSVHAKNLRDHEKGRQFDMVTDVNDGAWKSTSTYLRRGAKGSDPSTKGGNSAAESAIKGSDPLTKRAIWDVPGDQGRRYGAVSGDRNPIHMHSLTARLFGMPRPIAHGMWSKARSIAAIEARLPDSYAVEVSFKLPVFLPARVAFSSDGGANFALHDAKSGKPHLTGSVSPLR